MPAQVLPKSCMDFADKKATEDGGFVLLMRANPTSDGGMCTWANLPFQERVCPLEEVRAGWRVSPQDAENVWRTFVHPDDWGVIPTAFGRLLTILEDDISKTPCGTKTTGLLRITMRSPLSVTEGTACSTSAPGSASGGASSGGGGAFSGGAFSDGASAAAACTAAAYSGASSGVTFMPCHAEIHLAHIGEQVWVGTFFTPICGPAEVTSTSLGATLFPQAAARPAVLEIENKTAPQAAAPPAAVKAEGLGAKPACFPAAAAIPTAAAIPVPAERPGKAQGAKAQDATRPKAKAAAPSGEQTAQQPPTNLPMPFPDRDRVAVLGGGELEGLEPLADIGDLDEDLVSKYLSSLW